MTKKEKRTKIHLPKGTELAIDGECHIVKSGKVVIEREFLYSADDKPWEPTETMRSYKIDVELWEPDE